MQPLRLSVHKPLLQVTEPEGVPEKLAVLSQATAMKDMPLGVFVGM